MCIRDSTNSQTPPDPDHFYDKDLWSNDDRWHHLVDHAQTTGNGVYFDKYEEGKEFRFLKEEAIDYSKAFDVDGTFLDYNFIGVNPFHQALRVAALSGEDMNYSGSDRVGTKIQEFGTLRLYSRLEVPFSRQRHDDNFVEGNVYLSNNHTRGHKHPFSLDFPGLEYDMMTESRPGILSNSFSLMQQSLMTSIRMPHFWSSGYNPANIFRLGQNTNPDIPRSPVSKTFEGLKSEQTPYYDQRLSLIHI